ATVTEGGTSYEGVGVHLKGAAGSFRGIDDPRPGFTLSFSKFESRRKFHGTRKIHLNNAVQDASYLNENFAGELFRAAGVPAAQETAPVKRWQRLDRVLDLDRFLSFMVMEMMTCHWDGYCVGQNNFRIYHDPTTDKLVFLPHGMDQMFADPNYPIRPPNFNGLVAQAVIRTPEGRRLYRERLGLLFSNVFKLQVLTNRVNALAAQVRPALAAFNTNAVREFDGQAVGFRTRVAERMAVLEKFLSIPEPTPLQFESGVAK